MTTWTGSHEAVVAEQSWLRMEQERHQRLIYQLKAELRALRGRERPLVSPKLENSNPGSDTPQSVNEMENPSFRTPTRTQMPVRAKQRDYSVYSGS